MHVRVCIPLRQCRNASCRQIISMLNVGRHSIGKRNIRRLCAVLSMAHTTRASAFLMLDQIVTSRVDMNGRSDGARERERAFIWKMQQRNAQIVRRHIVSTRDMSCVNADNAWQCAFLWHSLQFPIFAGTGNERHMSGHVLLSSDIALYFEILCDFIALQARATNDFGPTMLGLGPTTRLSVWDSKKIAYLWPTWAFITSY